MKLVFTHANLALVVQTGAYLEQQGIHCVLRNEFASGAIGELAPIDAWPELWVSRARDADRALQLVEELATAPEAPEWTCRHCNNSSPDSFERCWHCGSDRYASPP